MKRVILVISILFCAQHLFSQTKLSGSVGDLEGKLGFTKANWEIYYDFELVGDKVMLNWTKPKITIPTDALYYSEGRTYTKAELGVSTWPTSNQLPYALQIEVNVSYPGGTGTGLSNCVGTGQCGSSFLVYIDPKKKMEVNLFKVVSSKFIMLNSGGEKELDDIIFKINNTAKPTSKAIPVATKTTDETSKFGSGDKQRALDDAEKKAKDDAFEAKWKASEQAGEAIASFINDLGAKRRERWAAQAAAMEARDEKKAKLIYERRKQLQKEVDEIYSDNLPKALTGNQLSQMSIISASLRENEGDWNKVEKDFPKVNTWLYGAERMNNFNAVNWLYSTKTSNGIKKLEEIAKMGSTDAMVRLALFYNNKRVSAFNDFPTGNNPEKALNYFIEATEKGNQLAMFYLAKIYYYKRISWRPNDNVVEYKIKKDEFKGFDLFKKIINNKNYNYSLYELSQDRSYWDIFDADIYAEVSRMLADGNGVKKDKILSAQFDDVYHKYYREGEINHLTLYNK